MAKILAAYENISLSDWEQLPPDLRQYFEEYIHSNRTYEIVTEKHSLLHDIDSRSIAMATAISIATSIGAILNVGIIFRMIPEVYKKHRLEAVLDLAIFSGWLLFQVLCIPVLLVHDVLVIPWRFGQAMCKIVPLITKTVKFAQCFTFLDTSLILSIRALELRSKTNRWIDSVSSCVVVPLTIWVSIPLVLIPVILQYGVVEYGLEKLAQCFNIDAVMDPTHNAHLNLHYFLWMMLFPLVGTVVVYIITKVLRCYRYSSVTYERVERNGENETYTEAYVEGYFRYLLVQVICYGLTWVVLQIMTLMVAFRNIHDWLPGHTAMFDLSMVMAYSHPCIMAILTLTLHPQFKYSIGRKRQMSHDKSSTEEQANGSVLNDVEASFEREPDGEIIVYSAKPENNSEIALL